MKKKILKKIKNKSNIDNRKSDNTYPVEPLLDRVLIKEDNISSEKTTSSGIIIPITVEQDRNSKRGVVVNIGKGRFENGKNIPISVKIGDKVLFQWGDKISVNDTEYYVVKESEIIAIIR